MFSFVVKKPISERRDYKLSNFADMALDIAFDPNINSLTTDINKTWSRRASKGQRVLIYHNCRGFCHYCGIDINFDNFHADHIRPWSQSHNTDITNLVAACYKCNIAKHTMSYERFIFKLREGGVQWRNKRYWAVKLSNR